MSTLNEEQLKRFTAIFNSTQSSDFINQVSSQSRDSGFGFNGNIDTFGKLSSRDDYIQEALSRAQFNTMSNQDISFTQLLTGNYGLCQVNKDVKESSANDQDVLVEADTYRVSWSESQPVDHELNHDYKNALDNQSSFKSYIFPEQGYKIVAFGTVFNEDVSKSTVHCQSIAPSLRRVSVLEVIVPTAPLSCPTEEWTVIVQALHSFVKWPTQLIFPRNMVDEIDKNNQQSEKRLNRASLRPCSYQGSSS
ncbi:hypothetical protein vseg_020657 [Gypsophila vaccaria]